MMFLSDYSSRKKVSFFTALCLICSMAEMLIPKPSFIKIGFSNIPVMMALSYGFSFKEYVLLVVFRIVFQALLNGTVFSYAFAMSATAGITSALAMYFFFRIPGISFVGLSETGAFFSNIMQLYIAHFFLGNGVYYLAPAVLGVGVVTSFILGLITPAIVRKLKTENLYENSFEISTDESGSLSEKTNIDSIKIIIPCALLFISFFTNELWLNFSIFAVLFLWCFLSKKRINLFMTFMVIFQAVILALIMPLGKVLFNIWFWPITEGSLKLGLHRAFVLLSSMYFSRLIIPDRKELKFRNNSMLYMILFFFGKLSESERIENH